MPMSREVCSPLHRIHPADSSPSGIYSLRGAKTGLNSYILCSIKRLDSIAYPMTTPIVAIIGAGASGTLVAAHLMQSATSPLHLLLIERGNACGLGTAYGTTEQVHLLNVPAGRMSAFPADPDHFLTWLKKFPEYQSFSTPTSFAPRLVYGRYLQDVLAEAKRSSAERGLVTVETVHSSISQLKRANGRLTLFRDSGEPLICDKVVLAIGNLAPTSAPIRLKGLAESRFFSPNPWAYSLLDGIDTDANVLLIGTGLTALDVVLSLNARGHRGQIFALSRNGLLPQGHKLSPQSYPSFLTVEAHSNSLRSLVHTLRAEIRKAAAAGTDWRVVFDSLRPITQSMWTALSQREKRRVLRWGRTWWDVHRHRTAPEITAKIDGLRESGALTILAGRMVALVDGERTASVTIHEKHGQQERQLDVQRIINCTGPSSYMHSTDPLLRSLFDSGTIESDPMRLGINCLPTGEVCSPGTNSASGDLFTVGPPTRGVLWESTAMPEIRGQAALVAKRLLASL